MYVSGSAKITDMSTNVLCWTVMWQPIVMLWNVTATKRRQYDFDITRGDYRQSAERNFEYRDTDEISLDYQFIINVLMILMFIFIAVIKACNQLANTRQRTVN